VKTVLPALTLALALLTGCLSPQGKDFKTDDKTVVPAVKAAMSSWYELVVADKVTAAQEIQMRNLLNAYLAAQTKMKSVLSQVPVDEAALAAAQADLQQKASMIVQYVALNR